LRRWTWPFGLVGRLAVVGSALFLAASTAPASVNERAPTVGAAPIVTGLDYPAAFTFDPTGRIFYGERLTGEVRIYDPATSQDTLFITIPNLVFVREQGLLGIALHPRYPTAPLVYVYATRNVGGSDRNQIIRIRDVGGVGQSPRAIWTEDIVAAKNHNGGRIMFGPGGRLFAVVGEAGSPDNAQNLNNDGGKILRMTPSGGVPPDNPFPGSLIWAYGIRNSFGFTFDPLTQDLWETENGPICNDELNRIDPGANYGWGPNWTCSTPPPPPQNTNQDGPNPVMPAAFFESVIAPVGNAFCVGCGIPASEGSFFFGGYLTGDVWQVTLTPDRTAIDSMVVVFHHTGTLTSFERGPDGAVYFSDAEGGIWKFVDA
jgi:aldose sugar dehydrogenase